MKLLVFWGCVYTPEEWERLREEGEEPLVIDTTWPFEKIVKLLEEAAEFEAITSVAEKVL